MEKKEKIIGKKILCSLLVVVMVMFSVPFVGVADLDLGVIASAADKTLSATGQCGDNVYWTFDSGTGEVVISGTGEMWDRLNFKSPFIDTAIKTLVIENGVTVISEDAFKNCTILKCVTIPESVTYIRGGAFTNCLSLSTIYWNAKAVNSFDKSYYRFNNINPNNGFEVIFGNTVKSIPRYAFVGCNSLKKITISNSTSTIGEKAFYDCTALNDICIGDGITDIGVDAFTNTQYYNNTDNWKNGVLYIGKYLIKADTSVKSCNIKEGTLHIAEDAFYNCKLMESVAIPSTVISIGDGAFAYCENLLAVKISDIAAWCKIRFVYVGSNPLWYAKNLYLDDELITSLNIPNNVTEIKQFAFVNCESIKSITIPNTVVKIGTNAFSYCTSLENLTIPGSMKYIGWYAFSENTNLKSVTFENGERNLIISTGAFWNCTNLNNIDLHGNRVYAIAADAFGNTAYYNNESNWDSGVLYLNDIILGTDPTKLSKKYTIEKGTTTLADGASFLYMPEGGSDIDDLLPVEVTVPNSVDNIGLACYLSCDKMPDGLFRCASLIAQAGLSYGLEEVFTQIYDNLLNELRKNGFEYNDINDLDLENLSIEEIVVLCKKGVFVGTYHDWVNVAHLTSVYSHFINADEPLSSCGVVRLDEGIKGIADNSFPIMYSYITTYVYLFPSYFDGLILPKSFDTLGWHTELCELYVREMSNDLLSNLSEKSITFLNPTCTIFDDENTLWEGYTICGYTGSTAEAYAKKYGRKFVAIDDCKHEKTCLNAKIDPTCGSKGYSGDLHCQYCGVFLEEGKMLDKLPNHSFGEPEIKTYPTCTKKGTAKFTCKDCGFEDILPYGDKTPHSYSYQYVEPTCTSNGYTLYTCKCGDSYTANVVPTTGHTDNDSNGYCDKCGAELAKNCSCNCHKGGISGFFFKIALLFQRIFGKNKYCSCGAKHY